jgi:Arc/MetJ-type ribon-helix-helix transcriptional regulator
LSRRFEVLLWSTACRTLPETSLRLPDDLQAFAEEQVRAGKSSSVADVVRKALEEKKLTVLHEALDVGVAELDAGKGVELSPEDLIDEVFAEVGRPGRPWEALGGPGRRRATTSA